jgi:hypothetical protein
MSNIFPSLFSLVFIAIGGAILNYAAKTAAKARQSLSWPTVEGEIAHSAILYQTNTTNTNDRATFKADISYRYKINGKNYSSAKVSHLDFATSSTSRAQSLVERYPDKSRVTVCYNPADPSEAVLEPGSTGGISILYGVGGIFAAAGLLFLLMSLTGHVHMRS